MISIKKKMIIHYRNGTKETHEVNVFWLEKLSAQYSKELGVARIEIQDL